MKTISVGLVHSSQLFAAHPARQLWKTHDTRATPWSSIVPGENSFINTLKMHLFSQKIIVQTVSKWVSPLILLLASKGLSKAPQRRPPLSAPPCQLRKIFGHGDKTWQIKKHTFHQTHNTEAIEKNKFKWQNEGDMLLYKCLHNTNSWSNSHWDRTWKTSPHKFHLKVETNLKKYFTIFHCLLMTKWINRHFFWLYFFLCVNGDRGSKCFP